MIRRTNQVTQNYKDMRGYTLLELMVSIAIVTILAATAYYSMIDSRRRTQEIVAMAEATGLGKTVISALADGADINFAHEPVDGSAFGGEDTSGNARQPIFFFSKGVRADVEGSTSYPPTGMAYCQATVWYANSDKPFTFMLDEALGINSFPDY